MMVASEAEDAWCPPTFRPSRLSRRWLALWIVQADSQCTLSSSSAMTSRASLAPRAAAGRVAMARDGRDDMTRLDLRERARNERRALRLARRVCQQPRPPFR